MRKVGSIMHDLEDAILSILDAAEMPTAVLVTHKILKAKYRDSREEYIKSGESPKFVFKGSIAKRKVANLQSALNPIVRELVRDHDMQWGEVLSLVNGYVQVHSIGSNYFFSYKAA